MTLHDVVVDNAGGATIRTSLATYAIARDGTWLTPAPDDETKAEARRALANVVAAVAAPEPAERQEHEHEPPAAPAKKRKRKAPTS